ncbi:MAG: LysM peptidoglycan-binding domain-containing protein [Treponema sp.]|jgi:nucleoid-associated protein YgaU|nr:LysM peptidoglycan-binding domain-containing protein [Treponema sp.]
MKKLVTMGVMCLFAAAAVFAQDAPEETPDPSAPLINNTYYQRSVLLTEQARDAFENGDYDTSARYAEEAAEYAKRSDNYVAMRLADNAIAKAHSRYTWAGSVGAASRYPDEYETATAAYNEASDKRTAREWDGVVEASNRVIEALAGVTAAGGQTGPAAGSEPPPPAAGTLPAQYTVRQWRSTGDCFWNIAGWSWVYGDSYEWRRLYEANKDKLPDPENPNLIEPGMILDIPSLQGEVRSGMWDPDR